ncbi:MAG TPA: trehalase family glycosidase [Bryobacteraceae bacterium]|jgi:hypothetical protein|nr:trehalase family glycosidase [Bryobacteraceae bacterium]
MRISRRQILELAAAAPLVRFSTPTVEAAFDAQRLPFSRAGSYWAVSKVWWPFGASSQIPLDSWYIRLLADDANPNEIFRFELLRDGNLQSFTPTLTPSTLRFGSVAFAIAANDLLQVRGNGCMLRLHGILSSYSYAVPHGPNACEFCSVNIPRVLVKAQRGTLKLDAKWADEKLKASCSEVTIDIAPDSEGRFDCTFEYYDGTPPYSAHPAPFEDAVEHTREDFNRFCNAIQPLAAHWEPARPLAAWVLWSSTVAARGLYRNPVIWCSKNWMNRIWSWDHCFVTVGLAPYLPEVAWQQLILFRDMQDPRSGVLADSMSNIQRSWLCTKPPIHGWALSHLMRATELSRGQLVEIYEPLVKWTNYWLRDRDLAGDGLPCLLNPNESFDNTTGNTLFGPVQAPETASYLVLQLEALSTVASKLGHAQDAADWSQRAHTLTHALVQKLWDPQAGKFVARRVPDGKTGSGDCIFSYVPIVLGKRLPASIAETLTRALSQPGRFLTSYGLASEALTSPRYDPDSYVKGPVWAPPNVFIAEGLDAIGQTALASRIRHAFLSNCLRQGMSEHFDAKTGTPAGDSLYNWTAAMFLHMARHEA